MSAQIDPDGFIAVETPGVDAEVTVKLASKIGVCRRYRRHRYNNESDRVNQNTQQQQHQTVSHTVYFSFMMLVF